jgi:hypothetical protein
MNDKPDQAPDPTLEFKQSCPFLGLANDRETRFGFPSNGNRCFQLSPAAHITLDYQQYKCLSGEYKTCTVFQNNRVSPLPEGVLASSHRRGENRYWIAAVILGIITIVAISLFAMMRNPSSGVDLEALSASQTSAAISTSDAELTIIAAAAENNYTPTPSATPAPSLTPTPTASPTQTLTPTPLSPTVGPGLETPFGPGAEFILHKVVTGESLQVVAYNYRTKKDVIASMNDLPFEGTLHPDMILVIVPSLKENLVYPLFHPIFIDQDATVSSIAEVYSVTSDDLRRYNSLGEGDILPGGRWIVIPINRTPTP